MAPRRSVRGRSGKLTNAERMRDDTQAPDSINPAPPDYSHTGYGCGDRSGLCEPRKPTSAPASPPSYQVLDQAITAIHGGGSVSVHLQSGRLETLPLPPGVGIDKASLSPWEEDGRRQIVAVGWKRSGAEGSLSSSDFGLIRMSLPDGELLDQLILPDVALPMASLCWIPGTPASVLYVGGDFRLYRVDFGLPSSTVAPRIWPIRTLAPSSGRPPCPGPATFNSGT